MDIIKTVLVILFAAFVGDGLQTVPPDQRVGPYDLGAIRNSLYDPLS